MTKHVSNVIKNCFDVTFQSSNMYKSTTLHFMSVVMFQLNIFVMAKHHCQHELQSISFVYISERFENGE